MGKRTNPLVPYPSSKNKQEKPEKYLAEKTVEDVLLRFGDKLAEARRKYRQFVKNGVDQGSRPGLQGGGLVRSAGGDKRGLLGRKKEEREKGDARILGSGDFVNETLQQAEATFERKYLPKRPIEELVEIVAGELGVRPEVICSGNRQKQYADARSLLAWLAVEEVGHPAAKVARFLGITRMGIHKAVVRGSELRRDRPAGAG